MDFYHQPVRFLQFSLLLIFFLVLSICIWYWVSLFFFYFYFIFLILTLNFWVILAFLVSFQFWVCFVFPYLNSSWKLVLFCFCLWNLVMHFVCTSKSLNCGLLNNAHLIDDWAALHLWSHFCCALVVICWEHKYCKLFWSVRTRNFLPNR